MKRLKIGAGCLSAVVIIALIVNVVLWATDHTELIAGLWIGAGIGGAIAWVLSGLWSGLLLKSGAEIGSRNVQAQADVERARMQSTVEMWRTFRQAARQESNFPQIEAPTVYQLTEMDKGKQIDL